MAVIVRKQERPPFWRNATILKWAAQLSFLFGFIGIAAVVIPQVQDNLSGQNLTFGWDWLRGRLGFLIREGIDLDPATGARTVLAGAVNTLRVTISGVIAATLLGTIIGIGRLSTNWLVNKLASLYIETIRNIPLLLWMFFWIAVVAFFNTIDPTEVGGVEAGKYFITFTRKGIGSAWIQPWGGFYQWGIWLIIGAVGGYFLHKRQFRIKESTGREMYPNLSALGVLLVFAIIGWFLHPVFSFVGHIAEFIATIIGAIPTIGLQLVLAALAIYLGYWWINRFLDDRRTPAGLAKLTDDDWFRMITAALVALLFAGFFLIFSGLAKGALDISEDFFGRWLAPKFDSTSNVVDLPISEIEAQVASGLLLQDIAVEQELILNADLLELSQADIDAALASGFSVKRIYEEKKDALGLDERPVFVPPHKLVEGLTAGVAVELDTAIANGLITPAELGDELEKLQDRASLPMRWSKAEVFSPRENFLDLSPTSGIVITRGFFAVWIAVTLYTASFIAEIVRAGILAVSKGQNEAASSLGLSRSQALRFIVLPQAFRIIFPPLGNQYLNLFKNTSLGLAVAFPDIVAVGQTITNQTGQTVPVILIWMGFFLGGSLILSSIVNFYNRRLALVER
ncbi:MAG: ABC transporter permease subunit [Acidimicrobiia bacterium]|nr:ABC transporter permease subunit [Acidimicrobiia bacterium]